MEALQLWYCNLKCSIEFSTDSDVKILSFQSCTSWLGGLTMYNLHVGTQPVGICP